MTDAACARAYLVAEFEALTPFDFVNVSPAHNPTTSHILGPIPFYYYCHCYPRQDRSVVFVKGVAVWVVIGTGGGGAAEPIVAYLTTMAIICPASH